MTSHPIISILSPVYRAEKNVPLLVNKIREAISDITKNLEIILVEDGSSDRSW